MYVATAVDKSFCDQLRGATLLLTSLRNEQEANWIFAQFGRSQVDRVQGKSLHVSAVGHVAVPQCWMSLVQDMLPRVLCPQQWRIYTWSDCECRVRVFHYV